MSRSRIKAMVKRLLGLRRTRAVRGPMLVHRSYRSMVDEFERLIEMQWDPSQRDDDFWSARLRKYAHILDKGLQRSDCEPGHAASPYQDAVTALGQIRSPESLADPSVLWAKRKIEQYERTQQAGPPEPPPYEPARCDPDDLRQTMISRRSVRRFTPKPVDDETVRRIVEVVTWAPHSCNRQTACVYAANEPELTAECLKTCAGATCFSARVPLFLCFTSDARAYRLPREMWLPYLDVSLGIENCVLMAHALGVSLTTLTWAQHTPEDDRRLRELLDIPASHVIVVNAAGGYPEVGAEAPARKSIDRTCYLRKLDKGDR